MCPSREQGLDCALLRVLNEERHESSPVEGESGTRKRANYSKGRLQTMSKSVLAWMILALMAAGAAAQTTVTTSGTTSSGTVPVFNGTATVTNSPITVSGSNVGIGTTSPYSPLTIQTTTAWQGFSLFNGSGQVAFIANDASGGAQLGLQNTSDNRFVQLDVDGPSFFDGGNVGIGTPTPRTNLDIIGSNATLDIDNSTGNAGTVGVQLLHTDGGPSQQKVAIFSQAVGQWGRGNLIFALDGLNDTSNVSAANAVMTLLDTGSVGIGTTAPGAKLEVDGNIKLTANSGASITFQDGTIQSTAYTGVTCGGDYAESIDVTGDRTNYEPGDVLVLDADNAGKILKSNEAYSTSVSGIFSTKPGTVGRRQTTAKNPDEVPMAVVGIVPAKVSAENGPIKVGDLLVTSSTPGYAMKGTDRSRMLGAVVGKAMAKLDSDTGVIEVLVTLQ